MLTAQIRKFVSAMCRCSSGNATLMMAFGMPVLIGGAGLGVDLSQWYLWNRELQYAVDQAAIAGAWARTGISTGSTYVQRARQEFTANLGVTGGITTTPEVQLANFAGGVLNSVVVDATASKRLPFSHFITGQAATIAAHAQASFVQGRTFTSCLIATDEDETGAITISGNSVLTAGCGLAALSTDAMAIVVSGQPTVNAGWIIAAGGIDPWLTENTDDVVIPYLDGLVDPYEDLQPPNPAESQVARTYSCQTQASSTTADVTTRVVTNYTYFQGANQNTTTVWTTPSPVKANTDLVSTEYGKLVPAGTVAGTSPSGSPTVTTTQIGGSGNSKKYERKTITTTVSRANVITTPGTQAGSVQPGTYTKIHVGCDTTFAPGVYNIGSGGLEFNGQNVVSGSGVMFVLHDGGHLKINGGASINLTAMLASDLIAKGVSASDANKLSGMLVFEDRESPGSSKTNINGNASTTLNGTLYFPVSGIDFAGTAQVTSQCLMIAARTIRLTGTTNMTTFCPAESSADDIVATTLSEVRLVG